MTLFSNCKCCNKQFHLDAALRDKINAYKERLKTETNERNKTIYYYIIAVLNECRGRSSIDEVNDILDKQFEFLIEHMNEK